MPRSEWGDWLVQRIENADPDGVAVWYLGVNGLVLKDDAGTTMFVDPYLGPGDPPNLIRMVPIPFDPEDVSDASAIFVTHEHLDHIDGPSQAPILANTAASLYAPDDTLAVARKEDWCENWDVNTDQLREVTEGDSIEVGAFTVHVESANDPGATHAVTYVIEHEAGTVFHAGDSERSPDLVPIGEEYSIDVGVFALGTEGYIPDENGVSTHREWYNNENQIIRAAEDLQVDRLMPTHWDTWKGLIGDPTVLHHHARSYEYPRRIEVVEIGDRIDL